MYLYTWLLDSITPTILVLIRPALLGCLISLTFSMMMRLGMRMIIDYEDDFDKVSYKNRPTLSPMLSTIFWSLSPRCGKVLASSTRRISARRWGGDRLITE